MKEEQRTAMQRVLSYRAFRLMKKEGLPKQIAEERVIEDLRGDYDRNWVALDAKKRPETEERNHTFFTNKGIDIASIWVTPVMLKKSIADANNAVRFLLKQESIHDYDSQAQGTENRILKDVIYVTDKGFLAKKISFYRPMTKQGDPRFWPYQMGQFCSPGDELGLAVIDGVCVLFNLSKIDYHKLLQDTEAMEVQTPVQKAILNFLVDNLGLTPVANELLQRIKDFVGVPLLAPEAKSDSKKKRDTDVGMAVEMALGIPANSKKTPDYKGIELKAWRQKGGRRDNRHTLFCQVPNWHLSPCKSIREFVKLVGYPVRDTSELQKIPLAEQKEAKELRCTVSTKVVNSQKLVLRVDNDQVIEFKDENQMTDLLVWDGDLLRRRLAEKHPETFWISCRSIKAANSKEEFLVEKIHYTRKPLIAQFLSTIEEGLVTLDHMIGYRDGALSERGPAFKIHEHDLNKIFPENIEIDLSNP